MKGNGKKTFIILAIALLVILFFVFKKRFRRKAQ